MSKKENDKTNAEWREELTEAQYLVTREAHTERPFTGEFLNHDELGDYLCVCCGAKLFSSENKFDAHCGWPSFDQTIDNDVIGEREDLSHGRVRTEVVCNECDAHLGHVFTDGPIETTGLRYCINSLALKFEKKDD